MNAAALAELTARAEQEPRNPRVLEALGHALRAEGRLDEALLCFRRAIALFDPQNAENQFELGNACFKLRQYDDAENGYRTALKLNPSHARARHHLAAALYHQDKQAEALIHTEAALAQMPDELRLLNLRGNILQALARFAEAEACYRETLRRQPENITALNGLGRVQLLCMQPEKAVETLRTLLRIDPGHHTAHSLMLYALHHMEAATPQVLLRESLEWERRHVPPAPAFSFSQQPDPERLLRIGFVSGDFRHHPITYFLQGVFSSLNPQNIAIYVYANQTENDDATRRIMQCVPHWRLVAEDSDDALAQRIHRDGIDILVDLSGHTDRHRLQVFGLKPSPIQMSWLGYFGTTGLSAMDYIIADRCVIPPEEAQYYTEKPVYLPDGYLCFTPPADAPLPGRTAEEENRPFTFVSFNNTAKISPTIVGCWTDILHALSGSILRLQHLGFDERNRDSILHQFADHGIGSDRLQIGGMLPRQELLAAYCQADIALDTYPYNGGTTTAEALYMGVPVINLTGAGFVRRVGRSILTTVGLEEYIADTPESYVRKAVALAQDAARRATLRRRLRQQVINSSLCDGTKFARNLEQLWRAAWRDWCATRQA